MLPHLRIAGVVPDLGLIVAIAVGYQLGPEAGAITGFVAGFGFGLFLELPLGLYALAYALVGYGVGVLEGGLMRSPRDAAVVAHGRRRTRGRADAHRRSACSSASTA